MALTEEEKKERKRAASRRYYEDNREKINAKKMERRKRPDVQAKESEYNKKWRDNNRQKIRDRDKQYRACHVDEIKASRKRWYHKNRDREIEKAIGWKKAHPEEVKRTLRLWYDKNKDRVNRRSRYRGKILTDSYVRQILCSKSPLRAEHITPDIIALKRLEIKLKRNLKEQENG
jgi:hypothetical protein